MIVTERRIQLRLPRDPKRSKGLHLSDIIRSLAFRRGIMPPEFHNSNIDEGTAHEGVAWEEYVSKYHHPEIDSPLYRSSVTTNCW